MSHGNKHEQHEQVWRCFVQSGCCARCADQPQILALENESGWNTPTQQQRHTDYRHAVQQNVQGVLDRTVGHDSIL
jgi:hypothetical protein